MKRDTMTRLIKQTVGIFSHYGLNASHVKAYTTMMLIGMMHLKIYKGINLKTVSNLEALLIPSRYTHETRCKTGVCPFPRPQYGGIRKWSLKFPARDSPSHQTKTLHKHKYSPVYCTVHHCSTSHHDDFNSLEAKDKHTKK